MNQVWGGGLFLGRCDPKSKYDGNRTTLVVTIKKLLFVVVFNYFFKAPELKKLVQTQGWTQNPGKPRSGTKNNKTPHR